MEGMTHGDDPYRPWGNPAGAYPQYPPGYLAPGPYGGPPGGYPPPPPPPLGPTNPLAVWSVVFAFVFAPLGAVLGHLALGQIRRGMQRGRDLALVGMTLSYTFIVLTIMGLTLWLVTSANSSDVLVANQPGVFTMPDPAHTATPTRPAPSGAPAPDALSRALLSLDELRTIMNDPGLADTQSSGGGSGGGDATADPPECAGAVAAGLNTDYDNSGATGYIRTGASDPATATMIDQVAASFPSPSDARKFVTRNYSQWSKCSGKKFTISSTTGPGLSWTLGAVVVEGDRATLQNTLTARQPLPQYRILASKGAVVVDLSVIAKQLGNEPVTIADRILARVTG